MALHTQLVRRWALTMALTALSCVLPALAGTDGAAAATSTTIVLPGADIISVAVDPVNANVIYATQYMGDIYKSIDGGANWQGLGVTPGRVYHHPTQSGTLYDLSWPVQRSVNGGAAWTPLGAPAIPYTNPSCRCFSIDPTDSSRLFLGVDKNATSPFDPGTFGWATASADNGATWAWPVADIGFSVTDLVVNPSGFAFVCGGTGTYRSTDHGLNYTKLVDAHGCLLIDPHDANRIFIGGAHGVLRSQNGGSTWEALAVADSAPEIVSMAYDPNLPTVLYAGSKVHGVFRSLNNGATWRPLGVVPDLPWPASLTIRDMTVDKNGRVLVGVQGGLYISTGSFDMNGDTAINTTDISWLGGLVADNRMHWQLAPNANPDLDGDEKSTAADMVILSAYVQGLPVKMGKWAE